MDCAEEGAGEADADEDGGEVERFCFFFFFCCIFLFFSVGFFVRLMMTMMRRCGGLFPILGFCQEGGDAPRHFQPAREGEHVIAHPPHRDAMQPECIRVHRAQWRSCRQRYDVLSGYWPQCVDVCRDFDVLRLVPEQDVG